MARSGRAGKRIFMCCSGCAPLRIAASPKGVLESGGLSWAGVATAVARAASQGEFVPPVQLVAMGKRGKKDSEKDKVCNVIAATRPR